MKIIIDTHVFLWALSDLSRLSEQRIMELESQANTVYVSSITITELMIKASIGKLQIDFDPVELAIESGFELLDFSATDALLLKELPFHHKDPFDRMLIAQSIANRYPIMTDDKKIKLYTCKIA